MKQMIINFLKKYHKNFDHMTDNNIDAWVSEAQNNADNGWKHLEIKSWDSIDGQTKFFNLEKRNF
jgi:hypothetical protein